MNTKTNTQIEAMKASFSTLVGYLQRHVPELGSKALSPNQAPMQNTQNNHRLSRQQKAPSEPFEASVNNPVRLLTKKRSKVKPVTKDTLLNGLKSQALSKVLEQRGDVRYQQYLDLQVWLQQFEGDLQKQIVNFLHEVRILHNTQLNEFEASRGLFFTVPTSMAGNIDSVRDLPVVSQTGRQYFYQLVLLLGTLSQEVRRKFPLLYQHALSATTTTLNHLKKTTV